MTTQASRPYQHLSQPSSSQSQSYTSQTSPPSQQQQSYTIPPSQQQQQQQQGYYVPPPTRPYPSNQYHHSMTPQQSQPQQQPQRLPPPTMQQQQRLYDPRYEQTLDARGDYPDDDFYSDVDYDDGIDDGYYDHEDGMPDTTKESDKSMSWVWLYVIGLLTCLTVEVITLILAYFLDIVIVAPLLASIWLFAIILSLCSMISTSTTTSTSKYTHTSSYIRTQLLTTFLIASATGILCGLVASVQLKQAWYYEAGNYYTQVNPSAPASQYPNAVITDFATGSYVGKDYTGMITSGGNRYCVAPILGTGPNNRKDTVPISFWVMDMNCCVSTNTGIASPGHIQATCQHWSDTTLEGEIHRNPSESWIDAVFTSTTWYRSTSSDPVYYVELLSPGEHDTRQQKRRLTGYLIVALGPLLWPLLMILYAFFICFKNMCCDRKVNTHQGE